MLFHTQVRKLGCLAPFHPQWASATWKGVHPGTRRRFITTIYINMYIYIYVCVYTWAKLSWPHCDLNGLIFSRNHPHQTTYFRLVIILNSLPRYTNIAGKVGVLFAEGHGNWLTIGESGGCYKWTTLSSMVLLSQPVHIVFQNPVQSPENCCWYLARCKL